MIEILSMGSGLSLQDAGRSGWRRFGVPSGGAMDQRSMTLANALLGNSADAPVLEVLQQGVRICILEDCWLATTGAHFCSRLASGSAMPFARGEVLEFDRKSNGLYAYLAIPGGFQSERWLNSASTDLRNGLGLPIQSGSRLKSLQVLPNVSVESVARRISSEPQKHIIEGKAHFALYRGLQYEAFTSESRKQFIESGWGVSKRSDRTGYRLDGAKIQVPESIPSEPVLPGSFQITSGGLPIITMADGPTVGGYAKIALLKADDLDRLAQCAPGTQLTFSWIDSF